MAGAFGAGLLAGEVGLQGKVEAVLREDAAATNERARAFRRSEEFAERLAAREPALQGRAIGAGADSWTDEQRAWAHGHLYRVTDEEVKAGGAFLSGLLLKTPWKVTERGRAVAIEWARRDEARKMDARALDRERAARVAEADLEQAYREQDAEEPREAWRDEVIAKVAAEIDGRRKPVVDENDPDFAEVAAVDGTLDMPPETPAGRMLRLAERLRFLLRLNLYVDGRLNAVTSDEEKAFLSEIASLLGRAQSDEWDRGIHNGVFRAVQAAEKELADA